MATSKNQKLIAIEKATWEAFKGAAAAERMTMAELLKPHLRRLARQLVKGARQEAREAVEMTLWQERAKAQRAEDLAAIQAEYPEHEIKYWQEWTNDLSKHEAVARLLDVPRGVHGEDVHAWII